MQDQPKYSLKSAIRLLVRYCTSQDFLWSLLPRKIQENNYLRVQRNTVLEGRFTEKCKLAFTSAQVIQGPFMGLVYGEQEATGSALYPKLIGSYESELHHVFEKLLDKNYPLIIDIGFAEGYYLIGLGKKLEDAKLVGFDINPKAHELCSNLARLNCIPSKRLSLLGECGSHELNNLLPSRSLIICDCEGFEAELFTSQSKSIWGKSDLIIECHDFIQPNSEESVFSALRETHNIYKVETTSTASKLPFLDNQIFAIFEYNEKLRLINEGRPCSQTWLIAEAI